MVYEMRKLRTELDRRGIAWWDESDDDITRTVFEHNGTRWSVINGLGTYGGWRRDFGNQGLLEIWDGKEDEVGFLTADDALQIIFKEGEDDQQII